MSSRRAIKNLLIFGGVFILILIGKMTFDLAYFETAERSRLDLEAAQKRMGRDFDDLAAARETMRLVLGERPEQQNHAFVFDENAFTEDGRVIVDAEDFGAADRVMSAAGPNALLMDFFMERADFVYFAAHLGNTPFWLVKCFSIEELFRRIFIACLKYIALFCAGGAALGCGVWGSVQLYRQRLREMEEKIDGLSAMTQMSAGIAHEIKNPLTSIKGFLYLIMKKGNAERSQAYIPIILEEAERIESLVNQFGMVARPMEMERYDKVDLAEVVHQLVMLYGPQVDERGGRLTYVIEDFSTDGPGFFVYGNSNEIKQVLVNLIKNAIEAIEPDGYVRINLYKEESYHYVKIKDNGAGIAPEFLDGIGVAYHTTKQNGTGLGLVLSNEIIQRHGGQMRIQSKLRQGTELLIKFPRYNDPEEEDDDDEY